MRDSTLVVLALAAAAFLPNSASAAERVQVIGGKLTQSEGPPGFQPNRVNIVVSNLPAGFPARAGSCRTLTHEVAPKIAYNFSDGLYSGNKLSAAGFILDGRQHGRPVFPGNTYIKLCRDKNGKPAAFAIQLTYYQFKGNVMSAYSVHAENDGAGHGKSSVGYESIFNGSAGTRGGATSNKVNWIGVQP